MSKRTLIILGIVIVIVVVLLIVFVGGNGEGGRSAENSEYRAAQLRTDASALGDSLELEDIRADLEIEYDLDASDFSL